MPPTPRGPGGPALCMAAGNLGDNDQTPLGAADCQGFGNAAEILELGWAERPAPG
ncbi:MAG TPA: hypothetical protein VGF32_22595 [Streptosporangiaceae bacterium]